MGFLAYSNGLTDGDFTGDFDASPPVANLATPQVPTPNAQFTGATGTFTLTASSAFTVRVLALIGHDLPDGATVTWKDSADATIASQTIARFKNRPSNSYILLDADESHSVIKCGLANAGPGEHRIAAAFAGKAKIFGQVAGTQYRNQSDGEIIRIGGTDWAFAGVRRRGLPVEWFGLQGEIIGVNRDGTEYSGDDAETILQTIGKGGQVIVAPLSNTQAEIDATAIYGSLDSPGQPEHVDGAVMRVRFSVVESR